MTRPTFPLLSIWNLVFEFSVGTLSQNTSEWGSMLAKHGSRPSITTPWNSNGESPWNIYDARIVSPLFVIHDSRLVHQNSCSSVRCSCSRCSSASPSTVLCSVCTELKMCVRFDLHFVHTSFVYISMTYINVCNVCNVCRLFQVRSAVFQNMSFFYKLNFNLKLPYTQYTHLYSPLWPWPLTFWPGNVTRHIINSWFVFVPHMRLIHEIRTKL